MKIDMFGFRKQIQGAAGELRRLTQEVEKLRLQRDETYTAPMNRKDVEEWMHYWVVAQGRRFPELLLKCHNAMFRHACIKPGEEDQMESDLHPKICYPHDRRVNLNIGASNGFTGLQHMLCFCFPDQMKSGLTAALDKLDWINSGLPREERLKELNRLDKEIADHEKQIEELKADFAEAHNISVI